MAIRTSKMDQSEYDRWLMIGCPKVKRRAGIHTNITLPKASHKLPKAWRAEHEACAAAMLAGDIFSFYFDAKAHRLCVMVTEGGEWLEHDLPGQVFALLGVAPAKVAKVAKVPAPKVAKVPAAVAEVPAETVAEIDAAMSGAAWPQVASDYLARLVYAPKRDYAAAYLAHILDGAPMPEHPGTEWADKVRTKVARILSLATV